MERNFKAIDRYGATLEFELRVPTLAVENEGERHYRITYNKAIADGIYPRNRLREAMRQHNMWTEDDEVALKHIVAEIAILQIELEQKNLSGDHDKCLEVAKKMRRLRFRMFELFMIQQSVYINSAEGLAELVKSEVMMAACTLVKATGERYWKNYTEFVKERDDNTKSTVYSQVIELQSKILDGLREGMESGYAENKYLKDVKSMMLDREVQETIAQELEKRVQDADKVSQA